MDRYYYTDPLAAAWMAKHFKMLFASDILIPQAQEPIGWLWINQRYNKPRELFYMTTRCIKYPIFTIHLDSIHLLGPQIGDVVSINGHPFILYNDNTITILKEGKPDLVWGDTSAIMEHGGYKIIQRNGIAFHWPEVES